MIKNILVCCGIFLLAALLFAVMMPTDSTSASSDVKTKAKADSPLPDYKYGETPDGDLSTLADAGRGTAQSGTMAPQSVIGTDSKTIPQLSPEETRARQKAYRDKIGVSPRVPVIEGPPARTGVPIAPESAAPQGAALTSTDPLAAPRAPNDMVLFRQHDMTAAEVPTGQRSAIQEPSVINVGDAVFYTANWYAARSADGGQNFTYINPYTTFPSINNGFCCDQVTAYAPNQNMAIWGLQYSSNAAGGTFRIARTIGSAGIGANNWTYYDFNPQTFAFAASNWMDFPNMTVSATYLYIASNVFTSANAFAGNVIWRIPLAQLASGGPIDYDFFTRTDIGTLRLAENSPTTMYWVSFANTTQMRVYRWNDGPGDVLFDTVNLNAYTSMSRDGVSTTADGRNWAGRADGRPLGAYVANGVIGVFWMAKQDANFPQPYTIHARFNQSTRALITQSQIWNATYAWLYPNVTVNAAGNLGGVIAFGGGTGAQVAAYPNTAFWVIDDVQNNTQIGGSYVAQTSNAGPSNNAWGDFLTIRRHSQFPNTYVAAVFGLSGTTPTPRYIWFGRERDQSAARRTPYDFDGDGKSDVAVFRPSNGTWYALQSTAGSTASQFGASGDTIVPADYDGDGKTDYAVYRGGTWYISRSSLGFVGIGFGAPADIPQPADYNGDGKAEIAVFRPSNGTWYTYNLTNNQTAAAQFGASGDRPTVGDYDGDGRADYAVYRSGTWYIQRTSLGFLGVGFGTSGDKIVPADYDGDGKTDIAVFRPSEGTWYLNRSQLGFTGIGFGLASDLPTPADYDGDGKADVAVYRPSNGAWYLNRSSAGFTGIGYGISTDKPVSNAFVY